jgi:hypothetical protein
MGIEVSTSHNRSNDLNGTNAARRDLSVKKRYRTKMRVDSNRSTVTFIPKHKTDHLGPLITPESMKSLLDLMFLLSPVRPQKLLQKVFQNICFKPEVRKATCLSFISLLDNKPNYAVEAINKIDGSSPLSGNFFPPTLLGAATVNSYDDLLHNQFFKKNRSTSASAIAKNLPLSAKGSHSLKVIPSVVVRRIIGTLLVLTSKNASRVSLDILRNFGSSSSMGATLLDNILGLLAKSSFSMSSQNLEDLLGIIENISAPLSFLPLDASDEFGPSEKEIEEAASSGKEFVAIPRAVVSPAMLQLLCSILRLESCKDSLFVKVNNITRRFSKVESNRKYLLKELASVASELGKDSIRDLRSLSVRLNAAVKVSVSSSALS